MISHFVPAASRQELDQAFDKLSPELRKRYYHYRYAPPLPKSLFVQSVQVIRDGEVVFALDSKNRLLMLPRHSKSIASTGTDGVEEVVVNGEMVCLRVGGIEILNRLA